eukprot:1894_1
MSAPDIIQSAAKFLKTPAKPERRLEEKIRFLIYEKKLTQFQLIAALKQANLYNIETIEPILTMCYHEQNQKNKSNRKSKRSSTAKQQPTAPSSATTSLQNPSLHGQAQPTQPTPSWSPWWSTLTHIGIGLTSFIASYTVSTTASQNLVKQTEERTTAQLDTVKTEIKEQADLDRERQHRDLMEVVNLLKTQVQCVQQNLGVLKQSIDVIQTQMKFNSMGSDVAHASSVINRNMITRASGGDDGSIISSALSVQEDTKPQLGVIGNLLAQNDDGLDWLNADIVTSDQDDKEKKEAVKTDAIVDDQIEMKEDKRSVTEVPEKDEMEEDTDIIYHPDYKDMISTLPTDIIEIKQQLTDLLRMWQRMVLNKEKDLTADKIKAGFNALNFFINKILKRPFLEQTRKINTYNKQYKERLSTLPRIGTLLTLIGYEKDNVFWTLPMLCKEGTNDEKSKKIHDKQIEFLTAFNEVLSNLFNIDGALPFTLSAAITNIKETRDGGKKEEEDEKAKPKDIENVFDKVKEEAQNSKETQYSSKFIEVANMVALGKTPDDVQVIDDMPPDPNAPPSESKIAQQKKPFEVREDTVHEEDAGDDNTNAEDVGNGLTWFEQYEAKQSKDEDNVDEDNNPKDAVETDIHSVENQQNEE